jgi:hypothetical protein
MMSVVGEPFGRSAARLARRISANFSRRRRDGDGPTMRWILLGLTILGFALTFIAKTPGLLAIGIVLGFVGLFGLVFSIAADRVASGARPDTAMLTSEDLAAMRARREAAAKAAAAAPQRAPPPSPSGPRT